MLVRSIDNEFNYNEIKDKINYITVLLIILSSIIGIIVKSIISYIFYDLILDRLANNAFSVKSIYKYKLTVEYKHLKRFLIKKQNEDYQILINKKFAKFARKIIYIIKFTKHINNSIYSKMVYLKNIGGDITKYKHFRFYKLEKSYIEEYKSVIKYNKRISVDVDNTKKNSANNLQNKKDKKNLYVLKCNFVCLKYYLKKLMFVIYNLIVFVLILSIYYLIYLYEFNAYEKYGINNVIIALLFSLLSYNIYYVVILNSKIKYDVNIIKNKITVNKFLYFNKINNNSIYRRYFFNSMYKNKLLVIDICNTIYTKIYCNDS